MPRLGSRRIETCTCGLRDLASWCAIGCRPGRSRWVGADRQSSLWAASSALRTPGRHDDPANQVPRTDFLLSMPLHGLPWTSIAVTKFGRYSLVVVDACATTGAVGNASSWALHGASSKSECSSHNTAPNSTHCRTSSAAIYPLCAAYPTPFPRYLQQNVFRIRGSQEWQDITIAGSRLFKDFSRPHYTMPAVRLCHHRLQLASFLASPLLFSLAISSCYASTTPLQKRDDVPLFLYLDPAPAPEDGPPQSANAIRDPAYLPYHIAAIAGAYGASLVLVAILLFALSKNRREALSSGADEVEFEAPKAVPQLTIIPPKSPRSIPRSPVRNFSYPSPDRTEFYPSPQTPYVAPSPSSTLYAPGVDITVDQRVVASDRKMAQSQLEEMYKYVMEQEEAKQQGIILQGPPGGMTQPRPSTSDKSSTLSRREKAKPAHLNLSKDDTAQTQTQTQSRTSSILSALRSPKKKGAVKGINISSPLMTPNSATFPAGKHESREMEAIPPRQYAPAPPPPVPTDQKPFLMQRQSHQVPPITPDRSPESTQSIDERIGGQLPAEPFPGGHGYGHSRNFSAAPTEVDPISASSEHSQTPLIGGGGGNNGETGLPSSPRRQTGRLPSLPASPKPGASFQRSNAPSAVRTGGALPLRAYEPPMQSPTSTSQITTMKQTTFERVGPLSPMSARTPATGAAVPYSPYQPFTPCVPLTPSLVTRADRKRMKKMEPKTPTMEMVKDTEEVW